MSIIYLETHSVDPFYNLAFEEYIQRNKRDGDYLLLWQNANTIVVGRNQNTEQEINRAFVEQHHIQVVRRNTGGGAVYHDLGNLNYSFITDLENAEERTASRFTAPIVSALRHMGLDAEASGRNDILVSGRKVSGTAQCLINRRLLHHGTLLFDSNPSMIEGALRVDPEKFRSKGIQSVRSRVGNIRSFLPQDMDLPSFWQCLKDELGGEKLIYGTLSPDELAAIEKLRRTKFATWEWNFGFSPDYSLVAKRYWPGGCIQVNANIANGIITDIIFSGDFLSISCAEDVAIALCDCPFRRESVSKILHRFHLSDYFGTISADQILDTIFYLA